MRRGRKKGPQRLIQRAKVDKPEAEASVARPLEVSICGFALCAIPRCSLCVDHHQWLSLPAVEDSRIMKAWYIDVCTKFPFTFFRRRWWYT